MQFSLSLEPEFERESHRIDQSIWDAMALRAGESVLFCGVANNLEWMKRAAAIGVAVTVISDDGAALQELRGLPIATLRGSTSILPARDESFDATVAFHYLHEVDPLFHSNIVAELARVGKRCVIVEPAPPSDPLGLRIASLYSRAKRELGQFENYHHIDYWRKLVAIAKPNVSQQTFTFLRTPPPQAVKDTIALIIDTMAAEQTPEPYLAELRALAARPDAQLMPQARYVIVGCPVGERANSNAGTDFRDRPPVEARPLEPRTAVHATPFVPPSISRAAYSPAPTVYTNAAIEPEFPAVIPPAGAPAAPAAPRAVPAAPAAARQDEALSPIARNAFGLSPLGGAPNNAPAIFEELDNAEAAFGIPGGGDDADLSESMGWAWEPPEERAET